MADLYNRTGHYIFVRWFLLLSFCLFYLFSSPNLSRRRLDVLSYFHTWCGLIANLRCRSETCCTRLAENTVRKKVAKNRHLGTIAQLCRAISSQLRHVLTIEKKLLSSNMSSDVPQYGELRPTSGRDRFTSLGHPRVRHLCSAGRPSRWALAHILVYLWSAITLLSLD